MILKNKHQRRVYQRAGAISTSILKSLGEQLKVGVLPAEIDRYAFDLCHQYQVEPAFYGVDTGREPYQYATCLSINDTILHGIPSTTQPLQSGDVVKIDFGIKYQGFFTDHCWTWGLGDVSPKDRELISASRQVTASALPLAVEGNTAGDLGYIMRRTAEGLGFSLVKGFVGHGIGRELHEAPIIDPYARAGEGGKLLAGMVICIECQVTAGSGRYEVADDGWSILAADGSKAAMTEYMVVVGKKTPLVLTEMRNWVKSTITPGSLSRISF